MTERALDRLTRRVMLDAARREYGDPPGELPEHTFSPAFERKMKKLLRRGKHPVWYKALHAAACLLLALILSGCAVLAVSPEAREVFGGWVREIHDTYFLYKFFGDEERRPVSKENVLYQPAYVPAGYRIERRTVQSVGIVTICYIDDQTHNIAIFTYFPDTSSPVLQVTGENEVIYQKVQVNGISADLYLDSEEGEANVIVWVDEENGGAFRISGVLSGEELIRMAESVRAVPRDVIFRPSWLPEGYYETSAEDRPVKGDKVPEGLESGKSVLSYEDGKGGRLTITYAQAFDMVGLRPGRCEADAVPVLVGEDHAFLFLGQEETDHLVWVDGSSGVFFWVSGPFGGEELIQIAESLEAYEEPPPLEERRLAWVPAGYQELDRVMMRDQGHVQYQDDEGDLITLSYCRSIETANLYVIPTSDGEPDPQPVLVGGLPADLYLGEGEANILVWAEDGLLFSILAYGSAEELVAMAESMEVLSPEYRPAWVPEGYELYIQNKTSGYTASFLYKDPEGHLLHFIVQPDREGARSYLFPNESAEGKEVFVRGGPSDLYLVDTGGANSELVWWDPEAGAFFYISALLPEEDILKMAESVEEAPPSPAIRQPNWLPMGYRYAGGSSSSSMVESRYRDGDGNKIQFVCSGSETAEREERQALQETIKDLEPQSVSVNGQEAALYSAPDGTRFLVWSGAGPEELCWLTSPLDSEVLVQIAESVRLSDPS